MGAGMVKKLFVNMAVFFQNTAMFWFVLAVTQFAGGEVFAKLQDPNLFTPAESITLKRQLIAFGLGVFTQFWAGLFFERTKPRIKFIAQVILAGTASAALIGGLRDVLNVHLLIGGESGAASLGGWLGAEGVFVIIAKFFGSKGIPLGTEAKK
jgi:hypothetical protein